MATSPIKPADTGWQPKRLLAVAAHPDDLEYGIAGSVAKWVQAGAQVTYLILTNGNKGASDRQVDPSQLTARRRREQRQAADILGVNNLLFADFEDGELQNSKAVQREIVRAIRQYRPDTVITMDPTMVYSVPHGFINHPDHRAAGQATLDAVFPLARDHLSFVELLQEEKLEPHKVSTVLLINFGRRNFYVDISSTLEHKLKALAAHASQIADPTTTRRLVVAMAKEAGREANCTHAEAFLKIKIQPA